MSFDRKKFIKDGYCIINTDKKLIKNIRLKILSLFKKFLKEKFNFKSIDEKLIINLYYSKYKKDIISVINHISFLPEFYEFTNNKKIINIIKKTGIEFPVIGFNNIGGRGGVPFLNFFPNDDDRYYKAHQDFFYLPSSLNSVVLWVPLQNTYSKHGSIKLIPGSHTNKKLMIHSHKDVKKNEIDSLYSVNDFIDINVKEGQAILFSSFLIHKSGNNKSNKMRMAFQIRYSDLYHKEYIRRGLSFDKFPNDINIVK